MDNKSIFERFFKVEMLALVNDRVSNVRMTLAKALRQHFMNQISGAFINDPEVNGAVSLLKRDKNADVRFQVEDINLMKEENTLDMGNYLAKLKEMTIYETISENETVATQEFEENLNLESIIESSQQDGNPND